LSITKRVAQRDASEGEYETGKNNQLLPDVSRTMTIVSSIEHLNRDDASIIGRDKIGVHEAFSNLLLNTAQTDYDSQYAPHAATNPSHTASCSPLTRPSIDTVSSEPKEGHGLH
jgi:hypothetical protein